MRYIKSWFVIDTFSVVPISLILNTGNYNALARIARLPKLYKLVKVFRLVKIMKFVKERNTLIKYVNELFKLNAGFERLIFFVIIFLVLCHISSCFWIILTKLDDNPVTWMTVGGYEDSSNWEIYTASFYFVIATITTVGFGDISAETNSERVMCSILMCIGVFSFSFSIGSLSSMLSTIDSRDSKLKDKITTLNQIRR